MDKRELRLAIEKKFKERRELIERNASLRSQNYQLERKLETTHKIVHSKLGQYALDDCADRIVMAILNKAFDASRLVADEIIDSGDYVVGIDIPSLHVRLNLARMDVNASLDFDSLHEEKTIKYRHIKAE